MVTPVKQEAETQAKHTLWLILILQNRSKDKIKHYIKYYDHKIALSLDSFYNTFAQEFLGV